MAIGVPFPGPKTPAKTSGELHMKDMAIKWETSHIRQPHSHLTPPTANPDEYRHKTYITRKKHSPLTVYSCAPPSILKQSCLKTRAATPNDSARKTVFTCKMAIQGHLFRCRWKVTGGLHTYITVKSIKCTIWLLLMLVNALQTACICFLHRVSKKLCKLIFCQNFVKFWPIVKIFGTKIAERTSFSEVYSFSTSPNLCQRTTVLNADVPNCYITL